MTQNIVFMQVYFFTITTTTFIVLVITFYRDVKLVGDKELECLIELIVDVLCLHLLGHEVRDDGVHPEVKLLHSLLSILGSSLSTLQSVHQDTNLFLIFFLSLLGLFFSHFQGLQVLTPM